MTDQKEWWHQDMDMLANQLTKGVLNEMKKRITRSRIQNERLELNENTERMKAFFEREITRYNKRKQYMKKKNICLKDTKQHNNEMEKFVEELQKQCDYWEQKCLSVGEKLKSIVQLYGVARLKEALARGEPI
jgi:hypothetical protein